MKTTLQTHPSKPSLSIVVTSRNDNHGGDVLGRTQLFIDSLLDQCDRFAFDCELVIVDWNPPADRPALCDVLDTTTASTPRCPVRFITVPAKVHTQIAHAQHLPLFQMIAKNVGIRRACGEYILATNIDVLLSDSLMLALRSGAMHPQRMLRCDRHDVTPHPTRDMRIMHRLEWCRHHVVRINERMGSRRLDTGDFHRIYWDASPRVKLLETLQDLRMVPTVTRPRLHTNACGDFTLLHRDAWTHLRGYAQWPMYSMYLDGLLCTAAHVAGYREKFLPPPAVCYHLEHDLGSGWSPEGESALNKRLSDRGVPWMSHDRYHQHCVRMRRERAPLITNDENWGLADASLDETNNTHGAADAVAA